MVNELKDRMEIPWRKLALTKAKDDMARYYNQCQSLAPEYQIRAQVFLDAPVHELTCGTTVHKGWTGFDFSSVCGLDSHFDDQDLELGMDVTTYRFRGRLSHAQS